MPPSESEYEAFDAYYDEAKERVDQRITEILDENEDMTTKRRLLQHSVKGGKRIRPVLTVLVSEVYDSPFDKALDHAAIVELIHNASLIADDRYDEDAMRRGSPTFHKVLDKLPFGKKGHKAITGMSVMGANGLVALAFELVEDPAVAQAVGKGLRALIDGFFMEGMSVVEGVFGGGYERYVEMNKAKTGGLFALAAWMPATYVDAPEEQIDAARKYGESVGILYQIADDYADDDLPSFIKDPEEELEEWYERTTGYVDQMPPDDSKDLLRVAPAWMVYKMLDQEDVLDELDLSFIPPGVKA